MKKYILILVSLIIIVSIGFRIYTINSENANMDSVEEIYQIGQWVEYEGADRFDQTENTDGYSAKLIDCEKMTVEAFIEKYQLSKEDYLMKSADAEKMLSEDVLVLTMEYKNTKSENGYIPLDGYMVFGDNDNESYSLNETLLELTNPLLTAGGVPGFTLNPDLNSVEVIVPLSMLSYSSGYIPYEPPNWPKYLILTNHPVIKKIEIPENSI